MAISDDQTKIDPKSLLKFKDDLKDSDKLPGGQKLPVPRQTSRTSPEKPDEQQQPKPESKQQQPGVIVKDYKGNIVTEYMGKPDDEEKQRTKRSTVITGKDDEPITRAFSPDKDVDDVRDPNRMIRKPEKPLVDEKITRAFSPDKDQEEELLLPSQTIEPLSKMMEKPEKISRAFEPQKDSATNDDDDDWIQGLKSEILPSNIDDDDHQKPSQVKIESKKKSIDEPPTTTATRISEPEPVEKLIDTGDDEPVEEFAIDPLKPGKNIQNIISRTVRSKEPNKRLIIRFIIHKPNGESIEELDIDPKTSDKDIEQIINDLLKDVPSKIEDPKKDKVFIRILKRPQREQQEPTEDESIGEFQIDPKQPEKLADKIINDVILPEKSRKDPRQKIVLRFVIIKPDGSQSIEDLIVDPAQYADDKDLDKIIREILRKAPKKLENPKDQLIFRVLRQKPQSTTIQPMKSEEAIQRKPSTKSQTIPESKPDEEEEIVEEEADDDDEPVGEFDIDPKFPLKNLNEIRRKTFDSKETNKLIILRFIIRQPDGSESIEEMEIDPETSDEEIEQIINELLNESPSKIEDPKKEKIIFKILRRKSPKDQEPMEDEMIDEFSIDPKQPEKLADKIMEKTIKPVTKKSKDPRERIVIRFVIRRPDGSESIEELVIDPDMNDQDIDRIIRDILRQTPKKLRDQRDKPIIRVLKRRPQQPKQAEKPKYPGDEQTTKSPKKTSEQSIKSPSKSTTIDSDEESIGNFIIDPLKPENHIDQIVQSIKSQARDPRKKLILRIVHQIPDRSSTDQIEEYLIDSECPEFDIANILGELPEKVTDTREKTLINFIVKSRDDDRLPAGDIRPSAPPLTSDLDDNIIIRIVVQKPNQQRTIEEFQLPHGSIASRNDIENLIKQINESTKEKIKEPNTTIITRVIKQTPDGQESIKEYQIDQQTATDDIDKIIRSNIRPKQRRIITRVVIRKPDGSEHIEEIEIDPEVDDIDEIIRQKIGETATKITGPARVSTRLIRQKPDGNEEEMELYPGDQSDGEEEEDEDGDYDDELLEEFKIDPKSPDRNLNDIVNRMIQSKIQPSNDDSTKKLVIRYVIIRTDDNDNGEEIEEMIVDPQTTEEEIRDIIREILMETPKKLKNPNDRVVFRIIHRQSKYDQEDQTADDDEIIGEFEIDPKFPETNVDEIIHRTTTTTDQPMKEKIFIRLIIIRPGFGEQIEELEIDPKLDPDRIGRIIREMLLDVPNKMHEPQDRIIFVILRRPQRKRQRKQQQRKPQQQSEQQHDIDDIISRAIRSSVPLSSQQRKSCRLTTSSTSEEIINEIEIIPQTSEQTINDFVHRTIRNSGSSGQTSDMNIRIIIKILSRKSPSLIGGNIDNDELIEQFEMNPSTTSDKDIDTIVRKILRTIQSRRRESNERIILRIVKRKKTNSQDSLDDDDEPESATGDDIDEIIRKSLRTSSSSTANRDPNNKIITRVVHVQPSGDEKSIEEIELDPNSMEQDLDDILRKTIKTNRNKYPGGKIITRIIWRKSNGKESIVDEMPIDSKITEMDLDDLIRKAIRQTILRIKDLVNSKMITRIVRLKPGGSESIEELELDPDLQDETEQTGDDNNRRQQQSSYTKIITRIIRQKSNDDDDDDDDDSKEILEEFQTIPESPDSDIDDAIRESILSARTLSSSMLKDSNIQIITRVIRLKPNGEKSIEEFEMIDDPNETDSDNDNGYGDDNLNDNGIRKIIRTRSLTIKDSTGKIITRVVRKKSNEQQQREEQQQSDDTIGQFVRKTIRDKISPVKDKAGDFITRTFKPQTQQKISSTTTTTQTAGIKHQQQRPQTKTSESSSSFGFMRKTYSSAVKELPRDLKGKSPPFRAGGLPARDIHGNIIPSTMTTTTTTTRISKPTAYSAAVTAEARRPEPRKTTSQSIQDRVGNKFGKFVTPSSSSASSSSLSSRDSRSKSKTPPTTADNRPRMTFR